MSKFFDLVEKALDTILIFMMIVMSSAVIIQVASRYIFNRPTSWSEELARYLFVWVTFLGSAVVIRKRRHVDVSVLTDKLPPRVAWVVYIIADAAMLFLLGTLTWAGVGMATVANRQLSAAMDLPMSLAYAAMPVGTGLMFVFLIAAMVWEWKHGRRIGRGDQL
ncbi:MAG: TRAP transporter small permease [Deltaproteobacteria bacterium]|nr:TRAP transporter small permease [Deltaproteobacteria bacterium]